MATAKLIPIIILLSSLTFDASNGIEWYVYDSTTAHHTQKRNEDLWKYGCCQDTIGCRGDGPKYLGMDVFMRAYRFINDSSFIGLKDYVLMIHQVNYMVSNVFGSNYLPSEESIGRIGSPIEDDWWRRKLNAQCLQLGRNESGFITGFSVRVSDEAFFVCGEQVTKVKSTVQEPTTAWNRTNSCKCTEIADCQGLHPVFCDYGPQKLMSIAAVPSKPNDENPYLYGFYSTHRNHEAGKTPRNYTVKVWRYLNYSKDPIHSTTSTGYLTEVDTFKEDETGYYGMYFTNDGNACPFNGTYLNDTQIQQSDLTFEYLKTPRQPCLSFQMFIGCPQPWCFSTRFDASFTLPEDRHPYIYLAAGNYIWKVKDGDLPLKLPRVKDANKPIRDNSASDSDRHNPCIYYLRDYKIPFCSIPNIGAAVAYELGHSWHFVFYSTSENSLYYHKAWTSEGQNNSLDNPFKSGHTADKSYWYDAFWLNSKERTIYGFIGQNFEILDNIKFPPKYIDLFRERLLKDFHIEAPFVDAVVNRGNIGYFFYNNFYYEVPEYDFEPQTSLPKIFAMTNFFAIQEECYANDKEAYETLISRFIHPSYTKDQPSGGNGGGSGEHSVGSTQETISRGDGGGQKEVQKSAN